MINPLTYFAASLLLGGAGGLLGYMIGDTKQDKFRDILLEDERRRNLNLFNKSREEEGKKDSLQSLLDSTRLVQDKNTISTNKYIDNLEERFTQKMDWSMLQLEEHYQSQRDSLQSLVDSLRSSGQIDTSKIDTSKIDTSKIYMTQILNRISSAQVVTPVEPVVHPVEIDTVGHDEFMKLLNQD